ncbi:MAG: serine/threonine protein kinase [Verrucomicrobiales bacterium]|jgi:serine/threonine protein kinase
MSSESPGRLIDGLDPQQLLAEGLADRETPLPQVSGFELRGKLGEGGMGAVYRAWQANLGREVALKLVRPEVEASGPVFERLEREARAMARLSHPNIVAIHEFLRLDDADDSAAIVMELIEGETLRTLLSRNESGLPVGQALQLARQIGSALAAAHKAGLVHRDVKPENILIDLDGAAHVADFGLALPIDQDSTRLTRSGTTVGTLAYVAPEQLEGDSVDARADQFSFAVVIYEMLAGIRPHGVVEPPDELRKEISPALGTALLKAMRRRPEDRFSSIPKLLAALHSRSTRKRKRRSSRRKAIWAGAILVPVMLGLGALFFFLIQSDGWTDLLPKALTDGEIIYGDWRPAADGKGIIANGKSVLRLPVSATELGESYDVLISVRQDERPDGFALIFQSDRGFGSWDFNLWGDSGLSGVQKINGKQLSDANGQRIDLGIGKTRNFRLEIRPGHFALFEDGGEQIKAYILKPTAELMLAWPWDDKPREGLAISNSDAPTVFERVAWRKVES